MTDDVEVGARKGSKIDDGDVDDDNVKEVQTFTSAPKKITTEKNTVSFRAFDYQRKRNRNTGADDNEENLVGTPGTPARKERPPTTRPSQPPTTTRPYRVPFITGIQETGTGSPAFPTGTGSQERLTGSQRFLTTIQTVSPTERHKKDVKVGPLTSKPEEEQRKTSVEEEIVDVTEEYNPTITLSIANTSSSSTTESPPMVENVQRSVLLPDGEKAGMENNLQNITKICCYVSVEPASERTKCTSVN